MPACPLWHRALFALNDAGTISSSPSAPPCVCLSGYMFATPNGRKRKRRRARRNGRKRQKEEEEEEKGEVETPNTTWGQRQQPSHVVSIVQSEHLSLIPAGEERPRR